VITPAVWCACPDKVQARRYSSLITSKMETWRKDDEWICKGVFDGGFLHEALQLKLGWVTPIPSDGIRRLPEHQKAFGNRVNSFLTLIRGPNAEGRFADQVNKVGILRRPFRFSFEIFDDVVNTIEGLENIEKQLARGEEVGKQTGDPISLEEACSSPLLSYQPTRLDDLLQEGVSKFEATEAERNSHAFDFIDEGDVPIALRALFPDAERFASLANSPQPRPIVSKNKRKGKEKEATKGEKDKQNHDGKRKAKRVKSA